MTTLDLPGLVVANAATTPSALAIDEIANDGADGRRWTWSELDAEMRRWASSLASLGVQRGDFVLTMLPNDASGVLGWAAVAALGAVEVPVNHAYVASWLRHVIDDTQAAVAIVDERFWPQWEPVLAGSSVRTVVRPGELAASTELLTEVVAADGLDSSCIVYTSGTTGPSKGVIVPWRQWDARYRSPYIPAPFRTPEQVCYSTMGPFHVTSKIPVYDAARQASAVCTRQDWKTDEFLADVRAHACTYTIMVGTMAHFLRATPARADDADTPLELISMAPLFPGVEAFAERFGVQVVTAYSMTELPMVFCSNTFYEVSEDNYRWCGQPDPALGVRLVGDDGADVGPGVPGELAVQAEPGVITPGYLNHPDATAAAWRDGWFHTGDMFVRDEHGRYAFVDRKKDAIRRRGENISSFEIEAAVNAHPAVAESAAFAVPSEFGEDDVKVAVVLRPDAEFSADDLVTFLTGRVPRFAIPRYVEVLAELPKTPTQRVRKAELRAAGITPTTWDAGLTRRGG